MKNQQNEGFQEKIKLQTKLKKTRANTQINIIRDLKMRLITDFTEIQRIIREYYKPPQVNKLKTLEETAKFLGTQNVLELNHEDRKHLNRPIMSYKVESVIVSQQ